MNRTTAGFTNLLMAGMLVVLMAIGGVVTMVVRTSERVEQAQARMNTDTRAQKLAQYVMENLAADTDDDGIMELAPQFYSPVRSQPTNLPIANISPELRGTIERRLGANALANTIAASDEQYIATGNAPGYIPANAVPETLQTDADGNFFRVCSVKLFNNGAPPEEWPQDTSPEFRNFSLLGTDPGNARFFDQPVYVIVSAKNGRDLSSDSCYDYVEYALGNLATPPGDDYVHVVKYGELMAAQLKKRLAMIKNVPQCTNDNQFLKITWLAGQADPTWQCVEETMAFASQDLPNCNDGDRVTLDANGQFQCRNIATVNNIAGDNPSNSADPATINRLIPLDAISANICETGMTVSRIAVTPNNNYDEEIDEQFFESDGSGGVNLNIGGRYISCTGQVPGTRALRTSQKYYTSRAGSCTMSNVGYYYARSGSWPLLFLARDGSLQCLPVNRVEQPATNDFSSDFGEFFENKGIEEFYTIFVYDKGTVTGTSWSSQVINGLKLCPNNTVPFYDPDTADILCRPSPAFTNTAQPASNTDSAFCSAGSYIIYRDGKPVCVDQGEVLATITPATSCTRQQIVTWNATAGRFECTAR